MRNSNYQWKLPVEQEVSTAFKQELSDRKIDQMVGKMLWQRGVRTSEDLERFLHPSLQDLHDPFLLYDMEKTVERIQEAIVNDERILVYGDYDADGITSVTIMKEALELLGANVAYYLPNRFTDGYGPNLRVYQEQIDAGVQLIITVDNGVAGHEAIAYANSQQVDVIVTDHHELPSELPDAFSIIHPKHPAGDYPFKELAGVGVAFKVATALLDEVPLEFLDLAAIGTIADMVSLTGENRALVSLGLQAIKNSERLGLRELLTVSGVKSADVSESTIGFSVGPRLNAIGRLGDPQPAVQLLSTFDEEEAKRLAKMLDDINNERKGLVEKITEEAFQLIDPKNEIHLLAHPGWHEGVLGIVAGKIVKKTGRPTIVLTMKEDGNAKGSGRSIDALDLFGMLDGMRDLFINFGGHHAAVGLTLQADNLPELQERINRYIRENDIDLSQGSELIIDEELKLSDVTIPFIESLNILAPFGTDNPIPRFMFSDVRAPEKRTIGAANDHLKMALTVPDQPSLDVIGFGFGPQIQEFQEVFDVVGQLSVNQWNGNKKPQLTLEDFRIKDLQIFDYRAKKSYSQLATSGNTLIVSFGKKVPDELFKHLEGDICYFKDLAEFQLQTDGNTYQQLVIADCPVDVEVVKSIVQQSGIMRIYLICLAQDDAYLDGIGTREQYARLFKFVNTQEKVDVRYKLPMVAKFLKIPEKLLIFMIQVFFELEFVTINDGVLKKTLNPMKKELSESSTYQNRLKKIRTEEFLLLSDVSTIKTWLTMQEGI